MAAGKPIIAYGKGGALETVIPNQTGIHLDRQTWEDIGDAIIRFDPARFDPRVIREHAEQFSTEQFKKHMQRFIDHALAH